MYFNLPFSDGSDDEEDIERERRAVIQQKQARDAEIVEKRRRQREEEEERRFGKQSKIEKLSLSEYLQQERYSLPDDSKMKFRAGIENAANLFGGEDAEFVGELRSIKTTADLQKFIRKRFERIVQENDAPFCEWLIEFHQQVVKALERSAELPSETHLYLSSAENVFLELKEDIKSLEQKRKFQKWRENKEKEEAEKVNNMLKSAEAMIEELHLSGEGTRRAARELTRLSVDQVRFPHEDTSPDRRRLTVEAENELAEFMKEFFVGEKPKPKQEVNFEDAEDIIPLGFFGFDDMEEEDDLAEFRDNWGFFISKFPEWAGSKWNFIEKRTVPEAAEDDRVVPNWREELNYQDREPSFTWKATAEEKQKWMNERHDVKRKRHMLKVDFAAYDSPLNKMRIFIQPNDHFFSNGDDGPTTDYVDLTLRVGSLVVHSIPGPIICRSTKECLMSRRTECLGNSIGQLLLASRFPPCLTSVRHGGHFLGRFWYARIPNLRFNSPEDPHQQDRLNKGLVMQYTMKELVAVYSSLERKAAASMSIRPNMKASGGFYNSRRGGKVMKKVAKVAGVLVLTDWRLVYLEEAALTNAIVHFLPTNMGGVFFDTMAETLVGLIWNPNIEFHTIIFAFGGSPSFQKADFLRFWKQLTVHTTGAYEVFWMAQDWCDGLRCTEEQMSKLHEFNAYVEEVFETMRREGFENYRFYDIRKNCELEPFAYEGNTKSPNISKLQDLYFAYISFFVNEANCFGHSMFFKHLPEQDDFAANDSRTPLRRSMRPRQKEIQID